MDKYYPEDASTEGKVQWGKVALFAAFPPVAFYWGNRAQRRFNDIKSDKYERILSNAKRRVGGLSQMQYSKDWEKVLDVELARIERDFKSETLTYINHYFQAFKHSK